MKLSSLIAARPVFFFILLTFLVLLLPCLLTPWWYKTAKCIEQEVNLSSNNLRSVILSEIEITTRLLHPLSSSAINLARLMNSSLNSNRLSFSEINTRVAPSLFQAFSTIPHMSEISYIGLDGLFFSYYIDNSQTLAMYCNSSSAPDPPNVYANTSCYTQHTDGHTGNLYGEATVTSPVNINSSLLHEALNSTNGFASLGSGSNRAGDPLILNTASINGRGAVSLGFPVKAITNFFTGMNLYGGSLSMATNDGQVLVEGLPNTRMIVVDNFISFQSNKTINGNQQQTSDNLVYVECMPRVDSYHILNIGEKDYKVYCSPLELAGVKSVYALTVPNKGEGSFVHKTNEFELTLLIVIISSILISVLSFVYLIVRSEKREMHLCAALINQMEATQQAERKSMNKSLAFASASHDVRAALAGLTGLIEICFLEVAPGSELETNLRLMDGCTKDLMGLLNSILDTSKIDAGKMQLDEEEFNICELLEDVVDLYHPVAMKKEVDVVLDPFDGSLNKYYSHVKGDRGKLKQVLCNLLSNAVKFTSEGHVAVRFWVQKPSLEKFTSIIASNRNGFLQRLSCPFYKNKKAHNDMEAVNEVKKNLNCMEFVFEVDDTGKGIPKEKQQSVFENYVQLKDGLGGTGLGLGIVHSLVRLMGGEIKIVDKGIGEKGTCFRFNVFLTIDEANSVDSARSDVELVAPSPGLTSLRCPRLEGSQVVLLIANEERRRVSQRYMEHLGINVSIVEHWESLHSILRKMKNKLGHSPHSSVGKSDLGSQHENSIEGLKDVPLSAPEGTDHRVPLYGIRGGPGFVLLVIDATAGPFSELFRVVTDFRRDLQCCCKVVWLDKPTSRSINFNDSEEEEEMMDLDDDIISKPLHGSRLAHVIRHLPEFGAPFSFGGSTRPPRSEQDPSSSHARDPRMIRASQGTHPHRGNWIQQCDTQEEDSSASDDYSAGDVHSPAPVQTRGRLRTRHSSSSRGYKTGQTEIEEVCDEKPLTGKKFLVAEDTLLLQKLDRVILTRLGATVEVCKNGAEALQLVRNRLKDRTEHGGPQILPYDYILMDCEMPIMNGLEATKQIRKEEKYYGVHIPIIALTAHVSGKKAENTILSGMDVHLGKPLNKENLLQAIRYINNK
ncbi:hypothetical protein Ddye_017138 [Dipteronia dyeriana]|uniref:histidine kinase n=1 Tax=Dipteronia dyeriana TaxID=168575 RepID=A0AAD9WZI2_9ROSI|nr:hypothetical protein Ddye_017138 [Dipteronia dyeriana]